MHSVRAFRPSDFPPGTPTKRKQRFRIVDVTCPLCGASPGVECPTSGPYHSARAKAWRAETKLRAEDSDA